MKRQHPAPLSAVQWANKLVFRLLPEERRNKVSRMLILLFQWEKISNRQVANNKTFEKADLGRVHCSFITGMNSYFASFFFFFLNLSGVDVDLFLFVQETDVSSGQGLRFWNLF